MALRNESGGDNDSRVSEARELMKIIEDEAEKLSGRETQFVESIADQLTFATPSISAKQIFWLRDIKDKVVGG
jgi:hypothetical protein